METEKQNVPISAVTIDCNFLQLYVFWYKLEPRRPMTVLPQINYMLQTESIANKSIQAAIVTLLAVCLPSRRIWKLKGQNHLRYEPAIMIAFWFILCDTWSIINCWDESLIWYRNIDLPRILSGFFSVVFAGPMFTTNQSIQTSDMANVLSTWVHFQWLIVARHSHLGPTRV